MVSLELSLNSRRSLRQAYNKSDHLELGTALRGGHSTGTRLSTWGSGCAVKRRGLDSAIRAGRIQLEMLCDPTSPTHRSAVSSRGPRTLSLPHSSRPLPQPERRMGRGHTLAPPSPSPRPRRGLA